jgi:hypothetical protein
MGSNSGQIGNAQTAPGRIVKFDADQLTSGLIARAPVIEVAAKGSEEQ